MGRSVIAYGFIVIFAAVVIFIATELNLDRRIHIIWIVIWAGRIFL